MAGKRWAARQTPDPVPESTSLGVEKSWQRLSVQTIDALSMIIIRTFMIGARMFLAVQRLMRFSALSLFLEAEWLTAPLGYPPVPSVHNVVTQPPIMNPKICIDVQGTFPFG